MSRLYAPCAPANNMITTVTCHTNSRASRRALSVHSGSALVLLLLLLLLIIIIIIICQRRAHRSSLWGRSGDWEIGRSGDGRTPEDESQSPRLRSSSSRRVKATHCSSSSCAARKSRLRQTTQPRAAFQTVPFPKPANANAKVVVDVRHGSSEDNPIEI